ncbi:Hypothetical predicted protein [Marmota monax]|uniref:Uncharacterized protein n=1 Tax=Marmota monax TaxID=9995 RepID=A0A5E4B935_MARMO|nr:Hypothetical predicted protein [Marmota monax]
MDSSHPEDAGSVYWVFLALNPFPFLRHHADLSLRVPSLFPKASSRGSARKCESRGTSWCPSIHALSQAELSLEVQSLKATWEAVGQSNSVPSPFPSYMYFNQEKCDSTWVA